MHSGPRGSIRLSQRTAARAVTEFVLQPWSSDLQIGPTSDERSTLWVTQRADAGTRKMFRQQDMNFIDLATRTARLHLPGFLLDRSGVKTVQPLRTSGSERSPYSDLGSLVTRALLAEVGHEWTLNELSTRAGTSMTLTSRVIAHLKSAALVRTARSGRSLRILLEDPWPLFLRWTGRYRWTDNVAIEVAAPVGEMGRFLARFGSLMMTRAAGKKWALTLQAGASFLRSHATWDTLHVYVACRTISELRQLAREAEWEPSPQGRVVFMAPKYRRAIWWGMTEGDGQRLPTVHTIQLMLDLWHYPLRGREQAEQLARLLKWRAMSS